MSPEQFDQLLSVLKNIGTLAQTAGVATYDAAVRQAIINGYTDVVLCAVFVLLTVACLKYAKFCLVRSSEYETSNDYHKREDSGVWFFGGLVLMLIAILGLVASIIAAQYAVNNLFNPQWQAILILKDLIR